jgi:hypothetical protein
MTGTNCDWFTHNQSRSYMNHLVTEFKCFATVAGIFDYAYSLMSLVVCSRITTDSCPFNYVVKKIYLNV